ncbi:hypothetical protein Psta_0538 [Pirellula staleyi DSM 6068]|uniref:Prepilin-type N-terminal cleavage/methylation domain-containing protein n=1 Tax=Pirellula staleyi (strain ATCC 27377 / DSM 6068 / ICPB 4128) TaxID=530564 RepID=D2R477_PIRSD|nr:prepilin-type N-terminal cleavage/methylation domain-containing protein [Pirellula staleyi]ADB15225.1 hypothetical protein Psta_0538 [Pirellula staleyi DSM 6068]
MTSWFFRIVTSLPIASQQRRSKRSAGYTLIELLVVIIILLLLLALLLPIASFAVKDTRTRSAASRLQNAFHIARQMAIRDRRPCGVYLQVDQQLGGAGVFQVTKGYFAQEAPPYSGSTLGVRAYNGPGADMTISTNDDVLMFSDSSENNYLSALINHQPETILVRFDYKGEWFVYSFDVMSSQFIGGYPERATSNARPPTVAGTTGYPFQIRRLPKRTAAAFELPDGTAIDLAYSGFGRTGTEFSSGSYLFPADDTTSSAIVVMFNSDGAIESIYRGAEPGRPRSESINFLLGDIERLGVAGTESNLARSENLWFQLRGPLGIPVIYENNPDAALTLQACRSLSDTAQ